MNEEDNKTKKQIQYAEYYQNNKERIKANVKKYRSEHKEEIKQREYVYWKKNPERRRVIRRKYQSGKGRAIQTRCAKNWRHKNQELFNHKARTRIQNRPDLKLKRCIMSRIRKKLIGNGAWLREGKNTRMLLGCDVKTLRVHLESQFTEGMSWDTYGLKGWVVDHHIPCASFDLSNPEHQKICFNYRNLKPLWYGDNAKKSAKLPENHQQILNEILKGLSLDNYNIHISEKAKIIRIKIKKPHKIRVYPITNKELEIVNTYENLIGNEKKYSTVAKKLGLYYADNKIDIHAVTRALKRYKTHQLNSNISENINNTMEIAQ